ncbi:hypothetical protein MTR67_031939 [Solanum verrucosum]|uniref:DUF4283 domain-containing protein n=1 Tax=Solanum verrucosum TaxID=315347 RepID=A0AAF0ZIE1_SOLVR|nr:hypothetical protein MTR67_031939 [Solanum verrucosum]
MVNVTPTSETDLLKRCIVGKFQTTTRDLPTLNDVRRWACNTWKSAIGVSVFAINDGHFLFELPTKVAAEHVMAGTWVWKKMPLNLEWWSPITVFKLIGDQCGGFIEAEEETTLKNHMHWARIKVKGDGKMVPKEIEITSEGFVYTVLIWCEAPVTFRKEATRREEQHYGPMGNKGFFSPLMLKSVEESDHHVGTSTAGKNLNWRARDSTREANSKGKGPLSAVAGQLERKENLGPNFLGPKRQQQKYNAAQSLDIVNIEIQANLSRITTNNRFEELGNQDTGASNKSSGDQEGRNATDKDAAQIKKKPRDSERLSEPLRDEIEANCRILMEQGREGVLIPLARLAADEQGLWKKIIIARYGREGPWTTQAVKTPYERGLWRTIRNQWPKMWGNSVIKVGNGRKTMFWNDIWVGQAPLKQQFPDIYNLNQQKLATISEVKNAQGWNLSFRRLLNDWEVERMIQFYNTLEQAKSLNFEEDKLLWSLDKGGKFRVKAAYKMLNISTEIKEWWPWKMIWKGKIPHKVACFTWLVASQAVLTQDNLMKRGRQLCSRCFFCEAEIETVNHLFLQCKVTGKLWQWFINLRGIGWAMPRHTSEVLACWNRDGNQSEHKKRWKIVPSCIWWTIWKERNQRCFENKNIPFQSIKMNCLATFYFWCVHSVPKDIGEINLFLDSL